MFSSSPSEISILVSCIFAGGLIGSLVTYAWQKSTLCATFYLRAKEFSLMVNKELAQIEEHLRYRTKPIAMVRVICGRDGVLGIARHTMAPIERKSKAKK